MDVDIDLRYITLLDELCSEYKLCTPEYVVVKTVPMHVTVSVGIGLRKREATATAEAQAKEIAAEAMYKHLRQVVPSTYDFVEAEALERAEAKKQGRYTESKDKPWRPPLNIKVADYHLGMILLFEEHKRISAFEALQIAAPPETQLNRAAAALGLEPEWGTLPSTLAEPLVTVELPQTEPHLCYMGYDRNDAAQNMIDYLKLTLLESKPDPDEVTE